MNEKRIYQMIRLAIFEEHHMEQLEGVRTCFRSDYIGRHISGIMSVPSGFLLLSL